MVTIYPACLTARSPSWGGSRVLRGLAPFLVGDGRCAAKTIGLERRDADGSAESPPAHTAYPNERGPMKPRLIARWLATLMGAAALLITSVALAADVHVMISAGFFQAYSALAPGFERASGHKLVTTRGPSLGDSPETIPNRIKRGEPVDVVIAVGASIDDLGRQGAVTASSKVNLARSEIG